MRIRFKTQLGSALRILALVSLLAVLLAACGGGGAAKETGPVVLPLDKRIENYANSLREEQEWLWDRMLDADDNPQPSGDLCDFPTYTREPVVLTRTEQRDFPDLIPMVADVDNAAFQVGLAHDEWKNLCDGWSNANTTLPNMQNELTNAAFYLDRVDAALALYRTPPAAETTQ